MDEKTGKGSPASSGSVFVGRGREMAELLTGLGDARAGRGRLFLLTGEAGIGKTRIAEELATRASATGTQVAWGRCWEGGGAPAYWPWVQVLRTCLGRLGSEHLDELAGAGARDVAQIVPELRQWLQTSADSPGVQSLSAEQARFRLFESVSVLLRNCARLEPLMLVLDDLHDADLPSLLMLKFVARQLVTTRILIVGTYRDVEVRQSPTLSELLGAVLREGHQVPITGLDEAEVARLVRASAGLAPSERLVTTLCEATAGNPLFIDGVVRLMVAEGKTSALTLTGPSIASFGLPSGVREAIRRRLASLSPETRSALVVAAAIGGDFDLITLERVSGIPGERLVDLMEEAVARTIVLAPSTHGYRFAHALIRNALYETLAPSARIRLHSTIAEVLEAQFAADIDSHCAELAHHFAQAVEPRLRDKAIVYSIRAGDAANAVFAYEDAVAHFQIALEMLDKIGAPPQQRGELMAKLGEVAGIVDHALAVGYFEKALRLFESIDNVEEAAEMHSRLGAALSVVSSVWNIPRALEHFRKAEEVLGKGIESPSLGRLYIGIAAVANQVLDLSRGLAASARAMDIGQRIGDESIWTQAAIHHATYLLRSGRIRKSYALFDEAWEKADRLNEGATAAWLGGYARMALRDPVGAQPWYRRELSKRRLAQAPFLRLIVEGSLAIVDAMAGDLIEAVELASRSPSLLVQGNVLFYAGDWDGAASMLTTGLDDSRRTDSRDEAFYYRALLGWVFWAQRRYDRAELVFEECVHLCLDSHHRLFEMTVRPDLAMVCAHLGKPARAAGHLDRCLEIMSAGEEWRGLHGTVARAQAVFESANNRPEEAQRKFAEAVAIFQNYHVPIDELATLIEWGNALAGAGYANDAVKKFDAALELCQRVSIGGSWPILISAERARVGTETTTKKPE
jgi:tetratricopeptide (TPR) repeat protein